MNRPPLMVDFRSFLVDGASALATSAAKSISAYSSPAAWSIYPRLQAAAARFMNPQGVKNTPAAACAAIPFVLLRTVPPPQKAPQIG